MHVSWRIKGFLGVNGVKSLLYPKSLTLAERTSAHRSHFGHHLLKHFSVRSQLVPPSSPFIASRYRRTFLPKDLPLVSQNSRTLSTMVTTRNADRNGDSRKRKSSPIAQDRPTKLFKPDNKRGGEGLKVNGDLSPMSDVSYSEPEENPLIAAARSPADSAEWQATIERVVRNVVSIHFCQTCSFDTDPATSSEATGFVVDAERGYILTNRHVVGAGPFWGYCIFDNHEEAGIVSF